METYQSNYDQQKIKTFLATHLLATLQGKSGVLVGGLMGSGKSTAIGIQLGAIYQKNKGA
jgi:Tfp pilus assembly pilus retraction ATPase PilT